MEFAPVALFAFKRAAHTRRALESLLSNPAAPRSRIVVFCDGPRRPTDEVGVEETRRVVREYRAPHVEVVERSQNMGLAHSIIEGVSALCKEHGRAVVLEDDLVVAPTFLSYMNEALTRYQDEPSVYQVAAHMFPVDPRCPEDAFFMPFISSWGWATWERAWQAFEVDAPGYETLAKDAGLRRRFDLGGAYPYFKMLQAWKSGAIDSWAIRWNLSVFLQRGLVLYPSTSLVSNEGFDGSGSNCGTDGAVAGRGVGTFRPLRFPAPRLDARAYRRVQWQLARAQGWKRVVRFLASSALGA